MINSSGVAAKPTALAAVFIALTLCSCARIATYSRRSQEEGLHLYAEKMYTDAAGAFNNAIRQEPRDFQSHFYLGVCYEYMREYAKALQCYHTTLEVMSITEDGKWNDEFRQVVLDALASCIARHDDQEVELNSAEARARGSNKAENWFLLAKVYRLKGDAEMALNAYRSAANWAPSDFYIRKEFGLYLMGALNQRREAEYYLRQAFRLNPNDKAVNEGLAQLGIAPLPAYEARDPYPKHVPPYQGPLAPDTVRLSGDNTPPAPQPLRSTPGGGNPLPHSSRVETPRD